MQKAVLNILKAPAGKDVKRLDDGKIVELFLSRDEAAIAEVSEKYGSRLRALALHITNDRQTSEDCENETYFQAWNSIPPHEPKDHLYPFLACITRHIALNCCRSDRRLKRSAAIMQLSAEMEQCIPASDDTERQTDSIVIRDAINSFLGSLSEEKRNVFLRRYWYFDSVEEISERFGISTGKVKTMLFRMRARLRRHLEKEDYIL